MSKIVKVGSLVVVAIAIVAVVVLAVPAMALAQGPTDPGTPGTPTGPGGFGPRGGMMGGRGNGWMAEYQDEMHAAIAEELGLSVEEFETALASGQTVWQIAETQGISVETLQAAMLAARTDILAQAVADGVLTQAQADAMLAHMSARTTQGGGWGMGRGMMGRGTGQRGGYAGNCPYATE
jgi:hypothetical protein